MSIHTISVGLTDRRSRNVRKQKKKRFIRESGFEDLRVSLKVLAHFANLTPDGVKMFQLKYGNVKPFNRAFVPKTFWNYCPSGEVSFTGQPTYKGPLWKTAQRQLRHTWAAGFQNTFFDRVRLIQRVFDPGPYLRKTVKPAFFNFEKIESTPSTNRGTQYDDSKWLYPYHRAVLFLFDQPWRARFCAKCGERFVAASSTIIVCSLECRNLRRNQQKTADARKKNWYRPKKKDLKRKKRR